MQGYRMQTQKLRWLLTMSGRGAMLRLVSICYYIFCYWLQVKCASVASIEERACTLFQPLHQSLKQEMQALTCGNDGVSNNTKAALNQDEEKAITY